MATDPPKPPEKRRLPLLQPQAPAPPEPPAEAEEQRSPWQRVAIGVAATFLVWLPLSALVEALVKRSIALDAAGAPPAGAGPGIVAAHAIAFSLGAIAGGALTVRLGAARARREGALAGGVAASLAWLIALAQGAAGGALVWGLLLVLLVSLGGAAGAGGGALAHRWRARRGHP